jgi:hypothetical protein
VEISLEFRNSEELSAASAFTEVDERFVGLGDVS